MLLRPGTDSSPLQLNDALQRFEVVHYRGNFRTSLCGWPADFTIELSAAFADGVSNGERSYVKLRRL